MESYKTSLLRIPKLAAAAFGLTLILKLAAVLIQSSVGHATAFDDATNLLIHYPESIKAVFAFFAAVLFFLSITLIIEPSDLGRFGRQWIFIPSLHVTEHMLSLAIGVFAAWAVIESVTIGVPYGSVIKTLVAVLLAGAILGSLAAFCAVGSEFLAKQFDEAMAWLGRWRFVVLVCFGAGLIWLVFQDSVWNYKPGPLGHP